MTANTQAVEAVAELELIAAVLRRYPQSMAQSDALRAVHRLSELTGAQPAPEVAVEAVTMSNTRRKKLMKLMRDCGGRPTKKYSEDGPRLIVSADDLERFISVQSNTAPAGVQPPVVDAKDARNQQSSFHSAGGECDRVQAHTTGPREVAQFLRGVRGMGCNCDLDNWEPETSTGHSHVCRIHAAAIAADAVLKAEVSAAILASTTPDGRVG